MKTRMVHFTLAAALASAACTGKPGEPAGEPAGISEKMILSRLFTVDGIYKSMMGPVMSGWAVPFSNEAELIWITGFRSVVVSPDGRRLSQEFMCHSNFKYDASTSESRTIRSTRHKYGRLFTISQGQVEVEFPGGFGIPVMGNEKFRLDNQVLNMNVDTVSVQTPLELRYKNVISYVRESDTTEDMIPLYQSEAAVYASLDGTESYFGTLEPDAEQKEAACFPGIDSSGQMKMVRRDEHGQNFTYHWVLEPGEETRSTLITGMLDLPFDTTIHFIAVHMHPFAESLVLKDLTEDEVLFESEIENFDDRIGLKRTGFFSSPEGIPVFADHEYALVSNYNNTSGRDQDAMALIYLYLRDREFEKYRQL